MLCKQISLFLIWLIDLHLINRGWESEKKNIKDIYVLTATIIFCVTNSSPTPAESPSHLAAARAGWTHKSHLSTQTQTQTQPPPKEIDILIVCLGHLEGTMAYNVGIYIYNLEYYVQLTYTSTWTIKCTNKTLYNKLFTK